MKVRVYLVGLRSKTSLDLLRTFVTGACDLPIYRDGRSHLAIVLGETLYFECQFGNCRCQTPVLLDRPQNCANSNSRALRVFHVPPARRNQNTRPKALKVSDLLVLAARLKQSSGHPPEFD